MSKTCIKCQITETSLWRAGPTCNKCYKKEYNASEHGKANNRKLYQKHKKRQQEMRKQKYDPVKRRQYLEKWADGLKESQKKYYEANKALFIFRNKLRKLRIKQAVPKWLTDEQIQAIKIMYQNRPNGYHVDHIVPINGENVCGLHVPWNLQYLPAIENLRKNNKWQP